MLEDRYFKSACEVRDGLNGPMIVGYASVFNSFSENLGGFVEQIDPGAFNVTVTQADVRGLGNHDPNWLLGRTKPGTLRLAVDERGLRYEIDVNTLDPDGQRALAKVKRGDWDGSSFSFQCIRDEWDWKQDPPQRRVLECALVDVGPVTFPAYPDATSAARSRVAAFSRVAKRAGRRPEELAEMSSNEIRSLFGVSSETVAGVVGVEGEVRAGKTISAATEEQIRAAMDTLEALLSNTTTEDDTSTDDEEGAESSSARMALRPVMNMLARELAVRAMPDMGGDPDNLAVMSGAVAAAYLQKIADLGLPVPEGGYWLSPVADQDGDADGDGPTLFVVSDSSGSYYVLADGSSASVVAWDGYEWSSVWRSASVPGESRGVSVSVASAIVQTRARLIDTLTAAS